MYACVRLERRGKQTFPCLGKERGEGLDVSSLETYFKIMSYGAIQVHSLKAKAFAL